LLSGTWKNESTALFVVAYEFAADGALKVTVQGMGQPLDGRYSWTGDRTLQMDFQASPDVRQAYRVAAKAYKDQLKDKIQAGKLYERAGPPMAAAVRDELPATETFQVGLSEQPLLLILINENGLSQTFEKED